MPKKTQALAALLFLALALAPALTTSFSFCLVASLKRSIFGP
jgi:hypothetical protein